MAIQQDIKAAIIDNIITTGGAMSTTIKELVNCKFNTHYTTKQIDDMLFISRNYPIFQSKNLVAENIKHSTQTFGDKS